MIICLLLISCSENNEYRDYKASTYSNENFTKNVQIEMINASKDKLQITLINTSDTRYIYGLAVNIEVKVNDEWLVVPELDNATWTDEGYYLEPQATNEQTISISHMYVLDQGDYRAIKYFIDDSKTPTTEREYVVVEFSIKNSDN